MIGADTLPSGATLVDNGNGTALFNWQPVIGQAGVYPVVFTVSESGVPIMSDMEEVSIIIEAAGGCDVDRDDMDIILAARNMPAEGASDPRDLDGDGVITANDARQLVLLCTRPQCASE